MLQDFCALSTVIVDEINDAEAAAVESVEICKSISAAVQQFNADKTEAEQNLKAVQEDLRTKRGEQTELDQRLTSLREEAAAAELRLQTLRRDEEAANGRIASLQADEEDRNIRIAAQNSTLGINSSTITAQNGELNKLKEIIMKHNVHLRNIQKYKEEYPKMVARMKELDTKEAELAAREQALLRRSSGSALATPLGSVTFSQLGSIHSVAGASGAAGAAGGGSPDEALELGSGEARRPGL
jgi:chromosome segregation ATPase